MPRLDVFARRLLETSALLLALQVSAQTGGFGPPVRPVRSHALPLADTPIPRELGAGAEVLFVSGYEPSGGVARVYVDRPGRRVVLALSSYSKTLWEVEALSGTSLVAIVVGSNDSGTTVNTATATRGFRTQLPYATSPDDARFRQGLDVLAKDVGADRVHLFRGSYKIPSEILLSKLDAPRDELTVAGPSAQPAPVRLEFELLRADLGSERWSLAGPSSESGTLADARVVRGRGSTVYRLAGEQLTVAPSPATPAMPIELPPNFPSFSWPTGIAYDTDRHIVTVVTLGGEGFLYRYDAAARRWLDYRSLQNVDILSLSYDATSKRYLAWTSDGDLLFIAASGERLQSKRLASRLPHFGATYDKGNGPSPSLAIVGRGNDVALLLLSSGNVRRIWLYRVDRDDAVLTFTDRR